MCQLFPVINKRTWSICFIVSNKKSTYFLAADDPPKYYSCVYQNFLIRARGNEVRNASFGTATLLADGKLGKEK